MVEKGIAETVRRLPVVFSDACDDFSEIV